MVKNYKAKKLPSGDFLIEVDRKDQSEALLLLNSVAEHKVSVSPHKSLNTCRGVISEDDPREISREGILEGLHDQGVVDVKRIMLRCDGEERATRHTILTFDSTKLPESVKAGYLNCKVSHYIPNPRRCFRCQRFGHASGACRGKATCAHCGLSEHAREECSNLLLCANFSGSHPAYSRSRPIWKNEKEILTFKTKENISFPEVKRRLSSVQRGTFSEAVRRGPALTSASGEIQVSPADLDRPRNAPMQKEATHVPPPPKGTRVASEPAQHFRAVPLLYFYL